MPQYADNKTISLNSLEGTQRNGTMLSNILFNTGCILEEDQSIVDTHITVVNCQIPVSYYTINALNNVFQARPFGAPLYTTITIPVGNYNQYDLSAALTLALATVSTFSFTFNKATGKLTWVAFANFDLNFTAYKACAAILGFNATTYSSAGTVLTATYPLNLLGIKRISVKSYSLGVANFSSAGGDITLTTIPSDQPPYCMLSYINQNPDDKQYVNVKTISQIDILLMDESDNLLDFNNIPWTVTLMLEITRFKPDLTSTFKEILAQRPIEDEKISQIEDDLEFLTN
jgi:hypothetical protein